MLVSKFSTLAVINAQAPELTVLPPLCAAKAGNLVPSTTLVSNPLNVEVRFVFIASAKVFSLSQCLSLCFDHVTWLAGVVVPSSGGGLLL